MFTETQLRKMAEEYAAGASFATIAKKYNIERQVLYRKLRYYVKPRPFGSPSPPHVQEARHEAIDLRKLGYTHHEIGDRLAVSRQRVYQLTGPVQGLPRLKHSAIKAAVELLNNLGANLSLDDFLLRAYKQTQELDND